MTLEFELCTRDSVLCLLPREGCLAQLKRLFGLGLGGRLGSGEQYMSWIDIDDLVLALANLISDPIRLSGPVNVVAPIL